MKTATILTCRLLSILILVMLLSTALIAQSSVKIKERINISSIQAPLLKSESGGEFVVQFQFSGTLDPASACEIWVNEETSPCYDVTWGPLQATAPLMTGGYYTVIYLYARSPGTATYSYSANGQELKSGTISVSEPCDWFLPSGFSFYESFKFDHDSVVNDYWENVYVGGDGENCQANVQWSPSYLTTWTVVQGSEWGQLNDENGIPVGATYTARVADIQGLTFKFAPNVPDTMFCIIKAESNGIVRYKKIYPSNYKKPELVVTPPTDPNQFITGTDLPKMPNPVVTAQLKNFNGGEVDFHWNLTIKWKAKGIDFSTPQDITEKYEGDAMGQNSDVVDLEVGQTLYGETDMRGGDDITLTVTAKTVADGKVYTTIPANIPNPFIIKGQNPTLATALAELNGDQYAAIAAHESNFNQFHTPGSASLHGESYDHTQIIEFPFQGDDRTDIGMMQINSP